MPNHSPWTTVTVIAALGLIIYTAGVSKAEPESGETEPLQVTLNAPVQGAVLVPDAVQLQASAFAAPGSSLTLTFQGRRAAPFPGPDFTLVAIPDTQYYVSSKNGGTPQHFTAQTEWIVQNKAARNIVFVTQLGDCVEHGDNGGNDVEWRHATNALYRLENPETTLLEHGIPYGVAVGNHDQTPFGNTGGTLFYNQYFGQPHFAGRAYYGGQYGTNNNNHFELFSASGLDFIVLHLEYDLTPEATVLAWADELLKTFASRRAIVVSHYLMEAGTQAPFGVQGLATYNALKNNANLFLMLCGHVRPEEGQRVDVFNGRSVYTLMSDYQNRINGGNGWMRLLEFSPSNNVIRVKTFSPTLNQYETDADSQFALSYNMQPEIEPFTTIATHSGLASGAPDTAVWPELLPSTTYEWRVTATDGVGSTTSASAQFVTAPGGTTRPPLSLTDSDGDGISDVDELAAGTDPFNPDSVLRIVSLQKRDGAVELGWNSVPGRIYRLLGKENLLDAGWSQLSGDLFAVDVNTTWSVASEAPAASMRFFRVQVVGR
jgi:hypothetical protein